MEARLLRAAAAACALLFLGASYRTHNFVVNAPTPAFAKQVGDAAEKFRRELAILWLGQALPKWAQPCPITLQVGPNMGAGGATSFVFDHGEVFNWQMSIQGSEERILDSVLPHEVTHTIFASYFRQPLPRWADEGACTTVEHESERAKQRQMLVSFLKEDRGIAFSRMFAMKDYPPDVLPLYAQGYSLCRFLIDQKDRRTFVRFVGEGLETNAWGSALDKHYGFANLAELQDTWLNWVRSGSPINRSAPEQSAGQPLLASNTRQQPAVSQPVAPQPSVNTAPATAGEPTSTAVASTAAPRKDKLVPIRKGAIAPSEPGPIADVATSDVQAVELTRPQGIQRPRQQVLEWSQPTPAAVSPASIEKSALAASAAVAPSAARPSKPVKLSASAAQRYLPAAMTRSKAQPAAPNRDSAQSATPPARGES